mmetsp:Transcript_8109/g.21613  ORF Transcript_8109/g.21613 Transcript_8109/m.21613 type:complete len:107 (+) Transcript_8109:166-486(+)
MMFMSVRKGSEGVSPLPAQLFKPKELGSDESLLKGKGGFSFPFKKQSSSSNSSTPCTINPNMQNIPLIHCRINYDSSMFAIHSQAAANCSARKVTPPQPLWSDQSE